MAVDLFPGRRIYRLDPSHGGVVTIVRDSGDGELFMRDLADPMDPFNEDKNFVAFNFVVSGRHEWIGDRKGPSTPPKALPGHKAAPGGFPEYGNPDQMVI